MTTEATVSMSSCRSAEDSSRSGSTKEADGPGAVVTLLEALSEVPDTRDARGVRYPLGAVLALCVVGFVCGRQNLDQVRRFGRDNLDLLLELGFSRRRSPSVATLSRVLGQVEVAALQKALSRWLVGLVDSARKRRRCAVAAVDGKASRAAGVHVLNVFLHDVEQVVWQLPIEAKKNEISALRGSLEELLAAYPFLQILTGDAMFAGSPLCSQLIGNGRHYVFQIKADQKNLLEKMERVFAGRLQREVAQGSLTGEKKKGLCGRS